MPAPQLAESGAAERRQRVHDEQCDDEHEHAEQQERAGDDADAVANIKFSHNGSESRGELKLGESSMLCSVLRDPRTEVGSSSTAWLA